ncbi:unnamed protein product [Aspergillus oryzae var. brunneus]|uniref:Unnamed protein product n=2 Tax=Aspergillus oryzae TaxID=5062 RepID=A0AAN5BQE6_ASPOZ|nr:unnamed protein product [Aspergillus oryzae]GMG43707.1 unnamed protein product [Aspergillus oryzae var. brunneus]
MRPVSRLSSAGAQLQDERQQVAAARNPHEGHHAGAQFRLNVQVIVRRGEHVLEDDEHDGCDDGGDNGEEGRKEGQNEERKGAEEDKGAATRREEDHDEGQNGGQDEESEHPMRGDPGDLESVGDISGEGNWILLVLVSRVCIEGRKHTGSSGEQFGHDDLDRVEPVESLRFGAFGDATIIVSLTEIPQTDGVEIMETDGSRNTVNQDGIGDGERDDVGEVDLEEPRLAEDGFVGYIANDDQNQEDPCDEIKKGAQ